MGLCWGLFFAWLTKHATARDDVHPGGQRACGAQQQQQQQENGGGRGGGDGGGPGVCVCRLPGGGGRCVCVPVANC